MIGIICKRDDLLIPILDEDYMAYWKTIEEAKEFAKNYNLRKHSEIFFIDFKNLKITEQ